jgi:hypothetical protein
MPIDGDHRMMIGSGNARVICSWEIPTVLSAMMIIYIGTVETKQTSTRNQLARQLSGTAKDAHQIMKQIAMSHAQEAICHKPVWRTKGAGSGGGASNHKVQNMKQTTMMILRKKKNHMKLPTSILHPHLLLLLVVMLKFIIHCISFSSFFRLPFH